MRGGAHCGTGVGLFVIKGIAFRFNAALGFGGGRRLRACTHHLSGLIGGAVRASTQPCPFEVCDSVAGRRAPGIAGAGEGRGGEGVVCGAGGVTGGPGGWADVVVAGGGGG
jgi:hypothetical protein